MLRRRACKFAGRPFLLNFNGMEFGGRPFFLNFNGMEKFREQDLYDEASKNRVNLGDALSF